MNLSQNKKFHALLKQAGLGKDEKQALVFEFTAGQSTSSADMNDVEAVQLIRHLDYLVTGKKPQENGSINNRIRIPKEHWEAGNAMRNTVKYYARQMNWDTDLTSEEFWARIDNFCLKYCSVKKHLDEYLPEELIDVVTEFKAMYKRELTRK